MLTPAGPVPRAWAWSLDLVVWIAAMLAVSMLVQGVVNTGKLGGGVMLLFMFVSYWGYPVICEVYFNGRTLGKAALGLRVLRADGLPVGWRESGLRNLLLVADFLPMLYVTGLLSMLFDHRFRRLGDIVAGTQVVYTEPPRKRGPAPDADPLPTPWPLTPAQQRTLTALFEREPNLAEDRMLELADCAQALTGHTGAASLERLRGYAAGFAK